MKAAGLTCESRSSFTNATILKIGSSLQSVRWESLVIDRANYTGSEYRLFLTRSLLDTSLASFDGVFIGFHLINNDKWNLFRARGPIAFLFNIIYMFNFSHHPESNTIALIEMLCRVGFEQSSPVHLYYVRSYRLARQADGLTTEVLLSNVRP